MKRFGLVLFVCFGLQLSAASAPFLHLHAAEAGDAGHHGGAVVHRHIAAHHDDNIDPAPVASLTAGEGAPAVSAVDESTRSIAGGAVGAAPHLRAIQFGAPERKADALSPPAPEIPPDEHDGRLIGAPSLDSPSLRGPPR